MKIGFLGTGNVARALATGWAAAGHDVVLGSRKPEDREGRPDGGHTVTGLAEAAAHADVLVNATPGTASLDVLEVIGAPALAGKVLIDVAVGLTQDMRLSHPGVSLGEEIQAAYPELRVVKSLCTITAAVMVAPGLLDGPSTVFLSGDDEAAKRTAGGLLTDLGWPETSLLDLGDIATARGQEHFALLFLGVAGALGTHRFNVRVVPVSRAAAS
ncbi:NADPH-dependent F420 reductase [Streptomyces sp. NBC_01803]|uniref:NADPH-dependent F420 reductase n=1 Tax=Streptomyces sp. NBC_01803 TaxID=2975946 RepID=UPI002DD8447A|nr:NAD(P)-binding domain-containing protein [Streptomyces sp. NBC_01803]WSA44726.1 NAD(P)-binding domain-containing protein [Streptomyces sp. NBC_01803]